MNITVGDLLEKVAQENPDNDALVYVDRGLRYTYREFNEVCKNVAKGLMKLGIEKDEHIAIWATNKPEWVTTQFATGKMGAVLVTVNTHYKSFELEYLLKQSDSATLILMSGFKGNEYLDIIYELCPELKECAPGQLQSARFPKLKKVILLGEERHPGIYNWDDVLALGETVSDEELADRQQSLDPNEVMNMQYTSGTTGFPKGVMLTHNNVVNNARAIADCLNFTPADRLCIPVPMFHCFGCVLATMTCVVSGATMVPVESFNPVAVLNSVQTEKCTAVHGVPTMFIAELEHPDFDKYDLSSLRTGIMAGSPCPIEVMRQVIDKMGMKEITITYGQTEASPAITMTSTNDPIDVRVNTVGKHMPGVEVKIVNPETGEELPYGETGELCAKGYNIMKGYYKMPEATNAAIDAEEWLHTGDLAVMDEAGYCKITGRVKDMIIRGGENVYPREIEEFLYTHDAVGDVQVVGVPSVKYGEEVMACIRLREGVECSEEEIREYCTGRIAKFKHPRYIKFMDEFPMTASGKIQKYKLRELAIKEYSLEKAAAIETA